MTDRIDKIRERCEKGYLNGSYTLEFIQHAMGDIKYLLNYIDNLTICENYEPPHTGENETDYGFCKPYDDLLIKLERLEGTNKALENDNYNAEMNLSHLIEITQWIPVSERFPTEKDADRLGFILAYSSDMKQSTVCVWHYILDDMVTSHWMPLPEPPECSAKMS